MRCPAQLLRFFEFALVVVVILSISSYTSCKANYIGSDMLEDSGQLEETAERTDQTDVYEHQPNYHQLYIDTIIEALKRKVDETSQEKAAQELKRRYGNRKFQTQGWKRKRRCEMC